MAEIPPYAPSDFSDAEIERLRVRLNHYAGRMTEGQLIALSDTLHDALSRRRRARTFHRIDMRV